MAGVFSFLPIVARKWLDKNMKKMVAKYGEETIRKAFSDAPIDYLLRLTPDTSPDEFIGNILNGTFGKSVPDDRALVPVDSQGVGTADNAATPSTVNMDRYKPTKLETAKYAVGLPMLGDVVSMAGNVVGGTQTALGSMLAAIANSDKQSQYSHLTPSSYHTGTGLMAIGKTALGEMVQSIGNTISNRAYDFGAEKWAQAQADANRRFYVEQKPSSAQQELEAQHLRHADRRNNRLNRPGV